MVVDRKTLGPQRWWEYPVFWWEGVKFRLEMRKHAKGGEE